MYYMYRWRNLDLQNKCFKVHFFLKSLVLSDPLRGRPARLQFRTLFLRPQLTSKANEIILTANEREFCQNSESVQFLKVRPLTKSFSIEEKKSQFF